MVLLRLIKTSRSLRGFLSLLLVVVIVNTLFVQSATQHSHAEAQQQAIAFTNVNVVPFDRERILAGQTVIVRDGESLKSVLRTRQRCPPGRYRLMGAAST